MRIVLLVLSLCVGCAHAAVPEAVSAVTPGAGQKPEQKSRELVRAELVKQGQQLAAAGEDVRAEQYLVAALDLGADVKRVLPTLLRVCVAAERYEAALAYVERYEPPAEDDPQLTLVLAALEIGLGQVERARKNLEQLVMEEPSPQAHYMLGELYAQRLQDYGTADRHYREYLALAPNGPHAARARRSLLKTTSAAESSKPVPRNRKPSTEARP